MTEMTTTLKRTEIIEEAKQFVLRHGPANVLEFGIDIGHRDEWNAEDKQAVQKEASRQAHRVYSFLGFDAPWAQGR